MTSKKRHYIGTVFHFIDDEWKMRTFPIDIHEFKDRSTAENICNDCEIFLAQLNLNIGDLFIVTDEGANVIAAFKNDNHIRCICHELHTWCKRSLDPYKAANIPITLDDDVKIDINFINDVMKKMKIVVNAVRSRLLLKNELSLSLIVDCDTRWMTKLT
uniref:Transposase n=1 Tax=Panagrolaimus superbus TaxID=310955 RepID=A0A914Z8R8_9BILA